jgi:hypothetical protein
MSNIKQYKFIILIALCCCFFSSPTYAYSVLTHEALVDVSWEKYIEPLLLRKYPEATADQLKDAHAYAYGGAVAPDMGYYPFGSKLFTNLVHYVRSGDFVTALLDEQQDLNEYAFALGVLCHYYADKYGHPIGTNHCVPLVYSKDKDKFGTVVTYEQDPVSHVRMEFGFDILQTARGNYATEKYHAFIGFKVAQPVLERAFLKTYGIPLTDIFKDFKLALETFRWVVNSLFPVITRAAWASKKKDIIKSNPGRTRKQFEYKMHNANYYHEYGKKHEKPGFWPGVLAKVVFVLPKVGPLKDLKIKVPGPEGEKIFIQSFDTVQVHYTDFLKKMQAQTVRLTNIDFDTGKETVAGEYNLADNTYSDLLLKLKDNSFSNVSVSLKQNILKFYGPCNEKMAAMSGWGKWQQMTVALDSLNALQPIN